MSKACGLTPSQSTQDYAKAIFKVWLDNTTPGDNLEGPMEIDRLELPRTYQPDPMLAEIGNLSE
eukprot:3079703-Alexandrium_andersonii.AAC.1